MTTIALAVGPYTVGMDLYTGYAAAKISARASIDEREAAWGDLLSYMRSHALTFMVNDDETFVVDSRTDDGSDVIALQPIFAPAADDECATWHTDWEAARADVLALLED